jgi:peptide/nickel transport system substrate-binding protein
MLALAAISACSMAAFTPSWAQDATFVLNAREAGAPTYNPIKGTKLNIANNLIFDRMVIQDADGELAVLPRRHDLDLQAAPRREVP